jgi:hypothetical protein
VSSGIPLIKYMFESGADDVAQALEAHAPDGVTSVTDQQTAREMRMRISTSIFLSLKRKPGHSCQP